jgi:hypothetical protein
MRKKNRSFLLMWPNRKAPVAGDKVIIEKDKQVVLDVTPPA